MLPKHIDMQLLLSRTLRWGVGVSCVVAFVGGLLYLLHCGNEPFCLADYRQFSYATAADPSYTSLPAILGGFLDFTPVGWIQTGVLLLILTPILRVVLSFFSFVEERDWLYAAITAVVLAVIISNSLSL